MSVMSPSPDEERQFQPTTIKMTEDLVLHSSAPPATSVCQPVSVLPDTRVEMSQWKRRETTSNHCRSVSYTVLTLPYMLIKRVFHAFK